VHSPLGLPFHGGPFGFWKRSLAIPNLHHGEDRIDKLATVLCISTPSPRLAVTDVEGRVSEAIALLDLVPSRG